MPVSVECPHCGRAVTLSRKYLGTSMRCRHPQCGRRFVASEPGTASEPAPENEPTKTPSGRNTVPTAKTGGNLPFAQVDDSGRRPRPPEIPPPLPAPARNGGDRNESSSSSHPAERSQASTTKGRAPAKRPRPISVALLAATMAAFVAGWLAGTIRFSLPVPLILPLAAGGAVGWMVAFGAGGWGSAPRWGLLATAVGVGCAASLWSWATLFMWVKSDLHSFSRQKLTPLAETAGGWRDRLDREFALTQGHFNFSRFLRLRSLRDNESDLEVDKLGSEIVRTMGAPSEWQGKNDIVGRNTENQGFGGSFETFERWVQDSLRNKIRRNSRFEGGPLEPKGDLCYILMATEIVLSGVAAVLIYLLAIGQLAGGSVSRNEETEPRPAEASSSRNR